MTVDPETTLEGLLEAPTSRGVYRYLGPVDPLAHRAEAAGWSYVVVDGTAQRSSTLEAFAAALSFPEYFGNNLDALADCLRDVHTPLLACWLHAGDLAATDPASCHGIVDVLSGAEGILVLLPTPDPAASTPEERDPLAHLPVLG